MRLYFSHFSDFNPPVGFTQHLDQESGGGSRTSSGDTMDSHGPRKIEFDEAGG